ncbi:hypothetical protein KBA73_00895 [Patescibacteria group bacterium]|nr:hypothetical protein [Patescibacteria group bacterium]
MTDPLSDRQARIRALSLATPLGELITLVKEVFDAHFGETSDQGRLDDMKREFYEFFQALTRKGRTAELGDFIASSLVYSAEQGIDLSEALRGTLEKIERRAELYAKYGDKRRIAIYGGSFDMPQRGHVAIGKAIVNSDLGIDEVWYMPAFGYAGSKTLSEPRHRAAMCALLEKTDSRFKYFGYEIDHQLGGETVHTLSRLVNDALADHHRFHFVVSVETAMSIPTWPRWEELIRTVPFIVLPRPGYEVDAKTTQWFMQPPHRYLSSAQGLIELSSTVVRDLYAAGEDARADALVTPHVAAYIHEHGLYGATKR